MSLTDEFGPLRRGPPFRVLLGKLFPVPVCVENHFVNNEAVRLASVIGSNPGHENRKDQNEKQKFLGESVA